MRKGSCLILGLALLVSGCGGGSPYNGPGMPGPSHKGQMVSLPGDKGYAEIVISSAGGATGKKGQAKSKVVAYFYQKDGTTEMTPGPTDVSLKFGTDAKSPVATLTPAKSGGAYESEPGAFPEDFRGALSATVGGESLKAPFAVR